MDGVVGLGVLGALEGLGALGILGAISDIPGTSAPGREGISGWLWGDGEDLPNDRADQKGKGVWYRFAWLGATVLPVDGMFIDG